MGSIDCCPCHVTVLCSSKCMCTYTTIVMYSCRYHSALLIWDTIIGRINYMMNRMVHGETSGGCFCSCPLPGDLNKLRLHMSVCGQWHGVYI